MIVRRTLNIYLNYTYYREEDNRKEIGTELPRTIVEKYINVYVKREKKSSAKFYKLNEKQYNNKHHKKMFQ